MTSNNLERLEKLIEEQEYTERRIAEIDAQIEKELGVRDNYKEARQICQIILANTQSAFKYRIEDIMSSAINSVFNRFKFELNWKRTSARVDMNFVIRDGDDEMNLEDDLGCSILDLISLVSRPVFHRYQRPISRKLIVLDEPLKWLGRGEYLEKACEIVNLIAESEGYQLLIITHEKKIAMVANKAFKVVHSNKKSKVTEIGIEEVL